MKRTRKAPHRATIEAAASMLSPVEREVLRLASAEDLDCEAIAQRLGISGDAAEAHLANAIVGLHRRMGLNPRPWWRLW